MKLKARIDWIIERLAPVFALVAVVCGLVALIFFRGGVPGMDDPTLRETFVGAAGLLLATCFVVFLIAAGLNAWWLAAKAKAEAKQKALSQSGLGSN